MKSAKTLLMWRGFASATGPLCRCGCRTIQQDKRWVWRCLRGHFVRRAIR